MKLCPNCNNQLNDDDMFCTNCGANLSQYESVNQPYDNADQYNNEQNYNQQQDYYNDQQAVYNDQPIDYNDQQGNYNDSQPVQNVPQTNVQQPVNQGYSNDPYDHTYEFTSQDISENKVIAMALYLMGTIGLFIALLAAPQSPYVSFHMKQCLKFTVTYILIYICMILLCWTIIVPAAALIMILILGILKIVAFFQVCSGKAKEPAIIRNLAFLR